MSLDVPEPVRVERVLLPLDGSPLALAALPTARALATRLRARLTTISVAPGERDAERLRVEVLRSVSDHELATEIGVVVASDPAVAIVRRLEEVGPAVVCMSTHGRGRMAGAVIGSVARSVFLSSGAPVFAVGPQADRPGALVGRPRRRSAGFPEPLSAGSIVACVDGSTAAETVVAGAVTWALALDMELSVITVAEAASPGLDGVRPNQFGPPEPEKYVDGVAQRWRDVLPGTTGEAVYDPISVASGLRSYLATRPVGLVALTTHARSGFERLRFGATAAEIVRSSPVPALIVPLPNSDSAA